MATSIVPEVSDLLVEELRPERLFGWPLPEGAVRDERDLRPILAQLGRTVVDPQLLRPWVRFDPEGYVRVRLFRDPRWEMLLLCWLPGQASAVHAHGGSCGVTLVLAGELTERSYRFDDGPLVPAGLRLATAGDAFLEATTTIHRVENRGRAPALSLHLYAPPLEKLVAYEQTL